MKKMMTTKIPCPCPSPVLVSSGFREDIPMKMGLKKSGAAWRDNWERRVEILENVRWMRRRKSRKGLSWSSVGLSGQSEIYTLSKSP